MGNTTQFKLFAELKAYILVDISKQRSERIPAVEDIRSNLHVDHS